MTSLGFSREPFVAIVSILALMFERYCAMDLLVMNIWYVSFLQLDNVLMFKGL